MHILFLLDGVCIVDVDVLLCTYLVKNLFAGLCLSTHKWWYILVITLRNII
jgi:hypothetical protein